MRDRALKEPECTEELMELTGFIENARTMGMLKLNNRILVSSSNNSYHFTRSKVDSHRLRLIRKRVF